MGTSSVDLRNTLTAHGKNERRFTFAEVVYWLDQYRDLSRRAVNYAELVDKKLNKLQSVYDSTVRLYEELRNSIDGGSESMTHEDAVKELRSMLKDSEELAKLREQKPVAYAPSLDVRNIPKYGRMTTLKAEDEYATYMALYAAPIPAPAVPDSDTVRCARRYLALREHGILLRQDAVVFDVTDLDAAADRLMGGGE